MYEHSASTFNMENVSHISSDNESSLSENCFDDSEPVREENHLPQTRRQYW